MEEKVIVENPNENIQKERVRKRLEKLEMLKKISSGTRLREALDDIVNGGMGALIVVSNPRAENIFQGGFRINSVFTSKKLLELAKMDGGIILSEDFKRILFANTLLVPDKNIPSIETGTRHQAAERTAKQIDGLVIAVSERRGSITLYNGNTRYVLQKTEELLRRATETLQILEKQREVFDELITNMNLLELSNLVSVADVCKILERLEMISKMASIIHEYIVELGNDGIIVRMRMRELTKGIDGQKELIIKDYLSRPQRVKDFFENLSFEGLLDLKGMADTLFKKTMETRIVPKGYRILTKTSLDYEEIEQLIKNFKNLEGIIEVDEETLRKIIGPKTEILEKEINTLREHAMVGQKI
jgi:diadenylate cyclase